jgi:RNA polymerase sigma factor (sigma-70 family)
MKKYRKQGVIINGKKRLVDVPVDEDLLKADNREEYTRVRSIKTQVSIETVIMDGVTPDVAEAYEKTQLLECLRAALRMLSEKERLIIEYYYFDGFTEKQIAEKLGMWQPNVHRKKKETIAKLRNSLKDWL